MTSPGHIRHTFPKAERLCGKKDIEELFKHGSSFYLKPLLLKYHPKPESQSFNRLLVSVPKKKFKKAVHRNLIKRRIKEAYRLHKDAISNQPQYFDLGLVYVDELILPFDQIEKKLITLLKRLQNLNQKENEEKK